MIPGPAALFTGQGLWPPTVLLPTSEFSHIYGCLSCTGQPKIACNNSILHMVQWVLSKEVWFPPKIREVISSYSTECCWPSLLPGHCRLILYLLSTTSYKPTTEELSVRQLVLSLCCYKGLYSFPAVWVWVYLFWISLITCQSIPPACPGHPGQQLCPQADISYSPWLAPTEHLTCSASIP